MNKLRLAVSAAAIVFGFFIMAVSLMAANQVVSYEGVNASRKKLYFGQTILPDHVLYPAVAAADRVVLLAAPASKKVELQLAYGKIRLDYAQSLLDKDEYNMAQAALTKSQKYHSLAAQQLLEIEADEQLQQKVIEHLETNLEAAAEILPQLQADQQPFVNQLQQQNKALLQKLQEL